MKLFAGGLGDFVVVDAFGDLVEAFGDLGDLDVGACVGLGE